jgi:hypothetical protein
VRGLGGCAVANGSTEASAGASAGANSGAGKVSDRDASARGLVRVAIVKDNAGASAHSVACTNTNTSNVLQVAMKNCSLVNVDSEKRKGAACAAGASVAYPIARSSGTTKPGKSGANSGSDKENAAPRANLTNAASYGPSSISSTICSSSSSASTLTFDELKLKIDRCTIAMNMDCYDEDELEEIKARKKYYKGLLLKKL